MGKVEKNMTKGFYAAIAIAALLLLLLLGLLVVIRLMLTERKSESPSLDAFLVSRIEALQNTAIVVPRGEDKVYVIEDSPCLAYRTPVAF
ncbi:hepatitis A virus cellular receptor 1 homolog [Acomys russatus]|uniref:hepatitis A virus cellular receptor 1 homolog n=1 Tax=Acomys russatus TaxID=60746 RepID=UPI0021E20EEA|nr:hepatitis A virus cellular receptor 1 homolog [Acomys russatus]